MGTDDNARPRRHDWCGLSVDGTLCAHDGITATCAVHELAAETEHLRAVEDAARNIAWIRRLETEGPAGDLGPLAAALDDLDAFRGK